jgi:hypothetical protein
MHASGKIGSLPDKSIRDNASAANRLLVHSLSLTEMGCGKSRTDASKRWPQKWLEPASCIDHCGTFGLSAIDALLRSSET